jgi:protein TonB
MKTVELPIEEIIFENRNKAYGAYTIRKSYPKSVTKALAYSATFLTLLLVSPVIYKQFYPQEFELIKGEFEHILQPPPPIDPNVVQKLPELPPPPKPKVEVATIRSLVPEPTESPDVEEPPLNSEVSKAVISTVTQAGVENPDATIVEMDNSATDAIIGEKEDEPVLFVEQMPVFDGGMAELSKFLSKNLRYPRQATNGEIEGKVFVQFVVGKDGKVSQVTVIKGIGYGCDEEAVRVVSLMPAWTPGKQSGKPVAVRYNLPISFKLQR